MSTGIKKKSTLEEIGELEEIREVSSQTNAQESIKATLCPVSFCFVSFFMTRQSQYVSMSAFPVWSCYLFLWTRCVCLGSWSAVIAVRSGFMGTVLASLKSAGDSWRRTERTTSAQTVAPVPALHPCRPCRLPFPPLARVLQLRVPQWRLLVKIGWVKMKASRERLEKLTAKEQRRNLKYSSR